MHPFEHNFFHASVLLVPQVENSLRYLLTQANLNTTVTDEGGVQQAITLTTLLEGPDIRRLLAEDIVLEIETLLNDPRGPNLRNGIAHGLLGARALSGWQCIYAWWLVLKLCVLTGTFVDEAQETD